MIYMAHGAVTVIVFGSPWPLPHPTHPLHHTIKSAVLQGPYKPGPERLSAEF